MSINCVIDLNTQPYKTTTFDLRASESECISTADRLMVPKINDIHIVMELSPDGEHWKLSGNISANIQLVCSSTSELFDSNISSAFNIILSEKDLSSRSEFEDVEVISSPKVDISELALQYLALETPLNALAPSSNPHEEKQQAPSSHPTTAWKKQLEKLKS